MISTVIDLYLQNSLYREVYAAHSPGSECHCQMHLVWVVKHIQKRCALKELTV